MNETSGELTFDGSEFGSLRNTILLIINTDGDVFL